MNVILLALLLQFEVNQPQFRVESLVIEQPAQPDTSSLYVVMFTASWCGPCQSYKSSGQLADLQSQIAVTISDVDDGGRQWHSGAIPCFWICEKSTRRPLRKFKPGIVRPSVLLAVAKELVE